MEGECEWEAVLQTRHEHCCCHEHPNYHQRRAANWAWPGVKPCEQVVIASPGLWLASRGLPDARYTSTSLHQARADGSWRCGWCHGICEQSYATLEHMGTIVHICRVHVTTISSFSSSRNSLGEASTSHASTTIFLDT